MQEWTHFASRLLGCSLVIPAWTMQKHELVQCVQLNKTYKDTASRSRTELVQRKFYCTPLQTEQ